MAQSIERGNIAWLDDKGESGIIIAQDLNSTRVYFKMSDVLIGTPAVGKTAQFVPEQDAELGPIARNIIIIEDMARGAKFQQKEF